MGLMEPEVDTPAIRVAVAMRAEGVPVIEIAAHLGYVPNSVYRLLARVDRQSAAAAVKPPPPSPASMAELIAAARPWAQRPWSARGGLR